MKKRIIFIILPIFIISIIGLNSGECQLADSPWPKFRHDLRNTGRSPYFGPQKDTLAWFFNAGSAIRSSPSIGSDGTIYFGSFYAAFWAINPNGTKKWSVDKMGGALVSSPAINFDTTIYVGVWTHDHNFFAFNPNGTLKWEKKCGWDIKSSPAIGSDGSIYFGSADSNFWALNPDGTEKWKYKTKSKYITFSSPAIDSSGIIYIGCWDSLVYAFKPEGPPRVWQYNSWGNIESSPAIGPDGTIYIGVMGKTRGLHAINPDGKLKKIFNTNADVFSSPAIGNDGTIYVGSRDSNLYAFKSDGSEKWNYKTGGWVDSSPAIGADGKIYFGSDDHFIYCLNPDSTLKWRYETGGAVKSSPAIGKDGRLYVGSNDGKLYSFWGCSRGPEKYPPIADSLNLDNDAGYWGIYCERTPEWIMENVSEPSMDGTALRCGITGGDMSYSNVHCYRNFSAQADKDSFYLSLYFWFDRTTFNNNNSTIQALEFTMNKWQSGKRYEWALQWQNVGQGAPQWRYWDPHQNEKWISLGIKDSLEGEKWHFLEMIGKIDKTDSVHYLEFTVDSICHPIDIKVKPASVPGEVDRLAIAFQLDGNYFMNPFNVFVDLVDIANSPPKIKNISNFSFNNDQTYKIDLDSCVSDTAHQAELMTWQITCADTNLRHSLNNHIVNFFTMPNWNGITDVKFKVTDLKGSSDSVIVQCTILALISGKLNFYSNNFAVMNSLVLLTGSANFEDTTNIDGNFEFLQVPFGGDYTLKPGKEDDLNSAISPYDAALILQQSVGLIKLSPYQKIAADVSGNGEVTPYDASLILRYYVGLIPNFPIMPDSNHFWTFVPKNFAIDETNWHTAPDSLSYQFLESDKVNQDFVGIIYGDVNGNWMPSIAIASSKKNLSSSMRFRFGEAARIQDSLISIPIAVEDADELISAGMMIEYDPAVLKIIDVSTTELTDGYHIVHKCENRNIKVALAGTEPIAKGGAIINLVVQILKTSFEGSCSISISRAEVNDKFIANFQSCNVSLQSLIPKEFGLSQNYPNPFNPSTIITFSLPRESKVLLQIFNIRGELVRILEERKLPGGNHCATWNGQDSQGKPCPSGIYFYQLKAGDFNTVRKLTLLR